MNHEQYVHRLMKLGMTQAEAEGWIEHEVVHPDPAAERGPKRQYITGPARARPRTDEEIEKGEEAGNSFNRGGYSFFPMNGNPDEDNVPGMPGVHVERHVFHSISEMPPEIARMFRMLGFGDNEEDQ